MEKIVEFIKSNKLFLLLVLSSSLYLLQCSSVNEQIKANKKLYAKFDSLEKEVKKLPVKFKKDVTIIADSLNTKNLIKMNAIYRGEKVEKILLTK